MKENKGITLIALVVTIIVLLILAGVSIAMLTGQNGILTKAAEARDNSAAGTLDEATKIAVGNIMTNNLAWPYKITTVTTGTGGSETTTTTYKKNGKDSTLDAIKEDIKDEIESVNSNISVSDWKLVSGNKYTITASVDQKTQYVDQKTQYVDINLETGAVTKTAE